MAPIKTYWRANEAPARRVRVRVGTVERPTYWCAGLEGTERDAVAVEWEGKTLLIDDENGEGWRIVTSAYAIGGYASLPPDSVILSERTTP